MILDSQVRDHPHLEQLLWPDRDPAQDRCELGRYCVAECHDNWFMIALFNSEGIEDINYDVSRIPPEDRNRVDRLFLAPPWPK